MFQLKKDEQTGKLGIPVQSFFLLQLAFYTADASSYPFLDNAVFKTLPDGHKAIADPKISKTLQEWFEINQ